VKGELALAFVSGRRKKGRKREEVKVFVSKRE
jgi:hypothetical protein